MRILFFQSFCYKEYNTLASFGIYMTSALLCVLDNSVFSWGLGVGLMYMMSTGKAEIGRLNTAMDETAKVVQELKTELHKRKSSRSLQFSSSTNTSAKLDIIGGRNSNPVSESSAENRDNVHDSGFLLTEEGGSASSVLTDEPRQEVVEMDRLEAELESELQKLPWCSTEASGADGRISDICEIDTSVEGFCKPGDQDSSSYHLSGVLPSELDQKLCHLLIEQQESQIVDLESELNQAQSKLHGKEAELQALKDCVRRLTELSLANISDEETEVHVEEESLKDGDYNNKMPLESQRSVVGMKRAMDFQSYSCHVK
ncbi:protein POLAR-like 1 isoform X2 [Rhododendron vialii]|uniref:protein POLAR-like 1 isoform X2 n=1 Tax=Rhododendron vialii TaxID=182163 RepID=UPI00265DDBCE|nr:protein POLAR-like 1 isoform X2 [Rhododendron vialii]